ncbi:hypothetical protein ABPG77_005631 [Micractinium sp. CCAP 211/92]
MARAPGSRSTADRQLLAACGAPAADGPAPQPGLHPKPNHRVHRGHRPGSDGVATPTGRRDVLAANKSAAGDALDALCRAAESVLLAPGDQLWQQKTQQQGQEIPGIAETEAPCLPSVGSSTDLQQLGTLQAQQAQQEGQLGRAAPGKRKRGERGSPSSAGQSLAAAPALAFLSVMAAVRHRAAVVSGVRAVLRHLPPEDARSLAAAKAFLLQFPLGMDLHRV